MKNKPRSPQTPLLPKNLLLKLTLQGGAIMLGTFGIYYSALQFGVGVAQARTLAFAVLIISQMLLVLINRSERIPFWKLPLTTNRFLLTILALTALAVPLLVYVPLLQTIFKTAALPLQYWGIILSVSIMGTVWYEGVKWAKNHS